MFYKILLIICSIIFLLLSVGGLFIFQKHFSNIDGYFFLLSIFYIFIFSWGVISIDLKGKKRKEFLIGLFIMIILALFISFCLLFIAYYFKIKFPERGGAWYSALIGIPLIFFSMVLFEIIYKKTIKTLCKKNKGNEY